MSFFYSASLSLSLSLYSSPNKKNAQRQLRALREADSLKGGSSPNDFFHLPLKKWLLFLTQLFLFSLSSLLPFSPARRAAPLLLACLPPSAPSGAIHRRRKAIDRERSSWSWPQRKSWNIELSLFAFRPASNFPHVCASDERRRLRIPTRGLSHPRRFCSPTPSP